MSFPQVGPESFFWCGKFRLDDLILRKIIGEIKRMSQSLVKIKVHAPAGTIILDRPEKRNALNRKMLSDLSQAFSDLHKEKRVRAVILTGAGTAFCAGIDLEEIRNSAKMDDPQPLWKDDVLAFRDLLETMLRFPKPIIAAVNGAAVAGGAGLLLASDIVIAARGASFALSEPRRGLVAGIASPLLVFRIGAAHAANLLLTARTIDEEEAHRIGLFQEVVAPEHIWTRAVELADQCAESAPEALQLTRKMLNETIGEHLATLLSAGAAASATARTTEAAAEGIDAFIEKRPPKWP